MAVTGLFPPQAAIAEAVLERFSTRAQLFEHVLRRPEPLSDESLAAHVAVSGRSELIADAAADARMVRHADPALTVRSIIFVPLLLREAVPGVLILANSAGGGPFSSEDFSRAESFAAGVAAVLRTAESVGLPQP
jgi:sigma-B regulation protein RsbU (phosphoserine phosphatase)